MNEDYIKQRLRHTVTPHQAHVRCMRLRFRSGPYRQLTFQSNVSCKIPLTATTVISADRLELAYQLDAHTFINPSATAPGSLSS